MAGQGVQLDRVNSYDTRVIAVEMASQVGYTEGMEKPGRWMGARIRSDRSNEMSDATNDTTSQYENMFIRDVSDWTRVMSPPVTDVNFFQRFGASFPMPPVIGHTPEQKIRRFVWSRVCRVGHALHERIARFEKHEGDGYDAPDEYWLKRDWDWLESAGRKSRSAMPQPIYDPNWVRPKRTMTWGMGDFTVPDSDIIGVTEDGGWVRSS